MLKKLLVANLKFKFNWLSCLTWFCCCYYYFVFMSAKSGNPNSHTTGRISRVLGLRWQLACGKQKLQRPMPLGTGGGG